jgi:hypothetical protein
MQAFAAAFAVKVRLPALPATPAELDTVLAKYRRADALREQRRAAAEARDAAAQRKAYAADRRRWLAGSQSVSSAFSYHFPVDLRIVADTVETSHGARFPIKDARRGLALVERTVAKGKTWQANGHTCKLGPYQLGRIDPDGTVHAGCHVVSYKAIQRIAPQLKAV